MSAKTLRDLPGLKEGHVAELADLGIISIADMKKALSDEAKVKEMIKTLSGVGPKTVDEWRNELDSIDADKKESEAPAVVGKKATEIVEDTDKEGVHVVKAKPEISEETEDALVIRATISGRRPAFKRQEWFRYSKLGEKWRRPVGIHSKMRRKFKRRPSVVTVGYRGPRAARGLHPSGFEEVYVCNTSELDGIDPKKQAVRISGTVGTRKRIMIEDRAEELGIRVLNRMV